MKAFSRLVPAAVFPAIIFLASFGMKLPDLSAPQRPLPRPRAVIEEQPKQRCWSGGREKVSGLLDEFETRIRDFICELLRSGGRTHSVVLAGHDHGGHADLRQHVKHVRLREHSVREAKQFMAGAGLPMRLDP